ncbi:transmembrane protein EpsG [Bacillus sp. J14TS2]|uniref:EpsG family protein n=1 Tax=Bacillus sp. J14TS2 TaxID=2807188 RepID=UPI001B211785|nr:EpsG family protein [Bacillus sp. J14TS2]GIN73226.1 transmembrane protein EpsG [Bacillus sp. J14TS2]
MTVLWINFALVYFFSLFSRYFAKPVFGTLSSVPIQLNKSLMFGSLFLLVIVSGLRSNIGDTYVYKSIYETNEFTWEYILSQKDIGFGILQMLLKKISDDPQMMIFTTALLTNVLIVGVLAKYSRLFEISTYVYITGGLFLVSMNGIRQLLAAAIIFTGTKYLMEGKWLRYFLIVLIASTFHQSALILIPIYFIVRYKAWSKATYILLVFSIIIVVGYEQFSDLLFTAIEDSQYGHYSEFHEGGANTVRVVVDAVPLLIAFLGRDKLREIFPSSDYIVNMALIGFVFMIISTQNWIFARFSIYFSLYQLILISWIVKLFRKEDQRVIYFSLIVCYFLYYFYENVINLQTIYKSNILNFF